MSTAELDDCLADLDRRMSIPEVARRAGVSMTTAWRWVLRGVDGVRLSTFVVGKSRYTTPDRLAQFIRERTAVVEGKITQPSATDVRRRDKEIVAADAENEAEGWG